MPARLRPDILRHLLCSGHCQGILQAGLAADRNCFVGRTKSQCMSHDKCKYVLMVLTGEGRHLDCPVISILFLDCFKKIF